MGNLKKRENWGNTGEKMENNGEKWEINAEKMGKNGGNLGKMGKYVGKKWWPKQQTKWRANEQNGCQNGGHPAELQLPQSLADHNSQNPLQNGRHPTELVVGGEEEEEEQLGGEIWGRNWAKLGENGENMGEKIVGKWEKW